MKHVMKRGALGAAAAVGLLVACTGEQINGPDGLENGTPPVVVLQAVNGTTGSVDVGQPLALVTQATGERAIRRLTINVTANAVQIARIDTIFPTPDPSITFNSSIPLAGVTAGQAIRVVAVVRDVRNLDAADTLNLTASVSDPGTPPPGGGTGGTGTANAGPSVRIESPTDTTRIWPGRTIRLRVTATDSTDGVLFVSDTVRGAGLSTPLVYSWQASAGNAAATVTREHFVDIPAGAVLDSTLTIVAVAIDGRSQPGTPVVRRFTIRTQPADTTPPFVTQRVGARLEDSSAIVVKAEDVSPVRTLGYVLRDSAGSIVSRDSIIRPPAQRRTMDSAVFYVRFPGSVRGQLASVSSFADDTVAIAQRSNRGWSVAAGATSAVGSESLAHRDYALLVYGRTIALPAGSLGGDIAVDTLTGRKVAYVSNIRRNRLEVIDYTTLRTVGTVAVGSEPWGLDLDVATGDMIVANSGGTNLSVVNLGTRTETSRILTPNTAIWDITESVSERGVVKYTVERHDYSDRPQYVGRSAQGFIYYSTKPTAIARPGTIRRLRRGAERDLQQMWQYGAIAGKTRYALVDADNVEIRVGIGDSKSDELIICDHPAGEQNPCTISVRDSNVVRATAVLRGMGADVVAPNVAVPSLALTDTTFIGVGGDRNWIAFGEGATGGAPGRVMLFSDTVVAGNLTFRASPGISVRDLVDNASDAVYGVAVNRNSSTVGVQGSDAFYGSIQPDYRFQLRLQGRYVTQGAGAGMAFHPLNDGTAGAGATDPTRTSFVAGSQPMVDIVDSYYYQLRGRLPIRSTLYGPIKAALPSPAEQAAGIAVKLFGLTPEGLVVIDVRTADMNNPPTAALRAN